MAVGNVNAAPLEMNALAIKDMRLRLPELQERIQYHYRQEVLRQLYRILGSADFIGNPVGLFTNVSSGVADIFYEPFNGAVMHGNQDIGVGIAKVSIFLDGLVSMRYESNGVHEGCCKFREENGLRSFRQLHKVH